MDLEPLPFVDPMRRFDWLGLNVPPRLMPWIAPPLVVSLKATGKLFREKLHPSVL
jgi:hypothetical protein